MLVFRPNRSFPPHPQAGLTPSDALLYNNNDRRSGHFSNDHLNNFEQRPKITYFTDELFVPFKNDIFIVFVKGQIDCQNSQTI